MSLNSGETLQPFKALNQLIFDSSGNLIGIQNDRAVGNDLRIGGGSGVDGTFATLIATTALKLNSGATFDLYNTADQTTNYERVRWSYVSNVAYITSTTAGTGTARTLRIGHSNSGDTTARYFEISSTGLQAQAATQGANTIAFTVSNTSNAASGLNTILSVTPGINQSGTAGYTVVDINPTETATGSGTKLLQRWAVGGTDKARISNDGTLYALACVGAGSDPALGLGSAINNTDTTLKRDAADTLALRRSTNAQQFRIYHTYTDASNYRRWGVSWNSSTAIMAVVGAGTGGTGNLAVGDAALATGATVGYFMIPSCAGAPTGVPSNIPTGQIALHYDSTNNKLYAYSGAWRSTAALT